MVQVIENSFDLVRRKDSTYAEKALSIKNAEAAGQTDACPVMGREGLKAVIDIPRSTVEGFRARKVQLGTAVSAQRLDNVKVEDALYQIANGSTVNFAESYSKEALDTLLAGGVLPLVVRKPFQTGTYICILNIRAALEQGEKTLEAYRITDRLEPVAIETADYTMDQLENILF